MFEFLGSWAGIVMGVVALAILGQDLFMRRKIIRSELDLQQRKFESEKEERREWQRWLERERIELSKMYKPLSDLIAKDLISNSEWAVQAIEKAKLGPFSQTLFGDRSGHFREEKKRIAERFVPLLLSRCRYFIKNRGMHVYLIIDSGTTLLPFFTLLGKSTVQASENRESWVSQVTIVTNNLPGVQALMEVGRPNPINRYSGLAVDCRLLPGVPLPVYSAVTGKETEEALRNLHNSANNTCAGKAIFIGIITGNWIRIRKTDPRCAVPLARGEGHLPFKQALLDISDEVFVVGPLGKIFANASNSAINRLLGLSTDAINPEEREYGELDIDSKKARLVKLITTFRRNGRLLQNLSRYIEGQLQIGEHVDDERFISANVGETENIVYPFDELPVEPYLEKEMEFPHLHTRKDEFVDVFLHPEKELK